MQLFYTPDIKGNSYTLIETESKHAIRVLRLNEGDIIQLIDGLGTFYTAKITEANPKRCQIEVLTKEEEYGKRKSYVHVAVAPTKNIDRLEWFLEKATEIGIDEITPVLCDHSERKVIKDDRLEKVIISAMKQSLKAYMPKLNPLTPLKELLDIEFQGKKFIAHCHELDKRLLKTEIATSNSNLILIGPEGDFSETEIEQALKNEFIPVSLGNSRLRTETAALVACHTCNLILED
ncbi:16S rRNA (uracil(1498)-N(3))-methyltransferase [Mangrovibacterium lignilyticum]|uniref:16S rRNA (uracil(1498)-N(3))-methyltransferase n=1 Tax=Mangrovibacterium lignilyticum TaxID=2668052 RepID=UPI0013D4127B|nr:16S rRNA (uracil(1498)-N(3))-methyltransferase [Mangrovibacterium lignilyticum]